MNPRDSLGKQFGNLVKAVRVDVGWTQRHLAARIGISQAWISRIEAGLADGLGLDVLDKITQELGIRIVLHADSAGLVERRLRRDPAHAALVAFVARNLRRLGWVVATEVEIGHGRYRGWIDVLAFDSRTGTMLLIEVKTELLDFGGVARQVGRYEREAWAAARRVGWRPRFLRSSLVLLATEANEAAIREFRESLAAWAPNGSARLLDLARDPTIPVKGRFVALADPLSRRSDWLIRTRREGRRSTLLDADYAAFMMRRRRRRSG